MQTITLKIEDNISENFLWLLNQFSQNEVKILEHSSYISDDEYLRSIDGMVDSIIEAKNEPIEKGVTIDKLEW